MIDNLLGSILCDRSDKVSLLLKVTYQGHDESGVPQQNKTRCA